MLLGNPHYPWDGPNRFYRSHFTIPGKLNVVGVSYIGMPLIRMGHTDRIAWSNTVSTARRYRLFRAARSIRPTRRNTSTKASTSR